MPEPYAILLQLRRFGYSGWSSGGYEDQPHILLEELNRASEAEAEFKYKQELNRRNDESFKREYSEKMKPSK